MTLNNADKKNKIRSRRLRYADLLLSPKRTKHPCREIVQAADDMRDCRRPLHYDHRTRTWFKAPWCKNLLCPGERTLHAKRDCELIDWQFAFFPKEQLRHVIIRTIDAPITVHDLEPAVDDLRDILRLLVQLDAWPFGRVGGRIHPERLANREGGGFWPHAHLLAEVVREPDLDAIEGALRKIGRADVTIIIKDLTRRQYQNSRYASGTRTLLPGYPKHPDTDPWVVEEMSDEEILAFARVMKGRHRVFHRNFSPLITNLVHRRLRRHRPENS